MSRFQLPRGTSDADKILAYSIPEPNSGCWIWMGFCYQGYGRCNKKRAHRVSYEAFKCEIPDGLQIDHLCRNRSCVNPDHLEPVTAQVNCVRGETWRAVAKFQKSKTHCPQGHEYTPENTYSWNNKWRQCKICGRNRARQKQTGKNRKRFNAYLRDYRARKKAEKEAVS